MGIENKVYFIGAGSGDPELITVKGFKFLQQADVIMYADSLVNEELIKSANNPAKVYKSSGLNLEEMVEIMVDAVRSGKSVARVHTGDPSVYGAILEQMVLLKSAGVTYEVVPGVTAVFAAAAAVQAELTVPDITQTIMITRVEGRTPVPEKEKLSELAKHKTTIALYLSSALTEKVMSEFRLAGWEEDTPIAIVYRASWPDQKIIMSSLSNLDKDMKEAKITKHALILAGWALDPNLKNTEEHQSKLYDKYFTHEYRQGKKDNE